MSPAENADPISGQHRLRIYRYRAVIVLHDLHGLSNPEIAGLLDSPLSTVKIRVHRARLQLHQAILDNCSVGTDDRGVTVCEGIPWNPH